jgi:hypothetical protein
MDYEDWGMQNEYELCVEICDVKHSDMGKIGKKGGDLDEALETEQRMKNRLHKRFNII